MTAAALTESDVLRLAPDNESVAAARGLLRKKSFRNLGVSADQTFLLGDCQGSGKDPYHTSIDLIDPSAPTFRCSCPSRKFPCKHGLGLALSYLDNASGFAAREPAEDLLSKREKKAARAVKAATEPAAPKKPNIAALAKKAAAQKDGLDLLEKLLTDLVSAGQWFEKGRLDKLERQSKQLADAYLPAAMYTLQRLIITGRDEKLEDEARLAHGAELMGRLWATIQKGRAYLDNRIAGDESQAEADAVIDDVLGKAWQLTELKEKGATRPNLSLYELAFERNDDDARQQRVEVSHLLDLGGGEVFQAVSYRPYKGMNMIPEQPSYAEPMVVPEAVVYPGFLNRRVRWEKASEQVQKDGGTKHLAAAYAKARPDFKGALDAFRGQMKHPLAPRLAVMLLKCERLGTVGDTAVAEDAAGHRIPLADDREDYSNVANLVRAGGMLAGEKPALLARLFLQVPEFRICATPLAVVTPKTHLRLGI
jgi:hypothetical protein